jgi:hypothetical protein
MILARDNGHGVTEQSMKFWHENKNRIGRIETLNASLEPLALEYSNDGILEYNVEIIGTHGKIFLSGCNCGYGGTGPNGTAKILAELGLPIEVAREAMTQKTLQYDVIHGRMSA